ncbi:MAG: C25 family cysteine peptidase [Bacteroidales bacterium]|nr:C25 family cysteine peptidase [Bacteroidales bacterium]
MNIIHSSVQKQLLGWLMMLFLFSGFKGNAGKEIILNTSGRNSTTVLENTSSRLRISNSISNFNTLFLNTDKGEFAELLVNSYSKSNTIGSPQLPVLSKLIEIPAGSRATVKIVSFEINEYKLADLGITQRLIPVQAPQPKNNVQKKPLEFNEQVYKTNKFYGEALARVEVSGFLRNVQLGNLVLSPIEYNPVTNTIRVYDKLVVDVVYTAAQKAKSVENKSNTQSAYFENVFSNVLSYQQADAKSEVVNSVPIKYVIVSDPLFQDALQPFVNWKTRRGFKVIEAYTNNPAVGASLISIKAYLQNLYTSATSNDPAPTFVLFVGDVAQIPSFNCGEYVSDLYYCEYTGDYLPEVFYGRFSANTVGELLPQINKTLQYEQFLMPDPSYLNEVLLVAGADESHQLKWGNGQVNYGTRYYFNEAHNLVPHVYLQPEPAGSIYPKSIQSNISEGVSFASYSAHASVDGWADPTFTSSDVAMLQNAGKYGLIVGNGCQTNAFDQNSFGETLLRAENKGALGYIAASGLTYWDEDYWWSVGNGSIVSDPTYENTGPGAYDRIFHDHGEPRSEWYSTMGQIVFAGNLAVQESNSEMKKQYWESYCLMGDPSTMIYFGVPSALRVEYNPLLPLQASAFQVRTEAFASVAISKKDLLHGVAEADENGLAVVALQPFTEPGYADIVVTMQNRKPYIDSVKVETPEGPYLVIQNVVIKDQEGNNNNLPETGETLTIDISMENLGNSDALIAKSVLSTTDNYLTIPENSYSWPSIAGSGSASDENAFKLLLSDDIPDMHIAAFTITSQTGSGIFRSDFNFTVYSPKLTNGTIHFDDTQTGNGNGQIDPGETIVVTVPTTNSGHSVSGEVSTQLFVFGEYATTNSPALNFGKLVPGEACISTFTFMVSPDTNVGSHFSLFTTATAGSYNSVTGLNIIIGSQAEDFESGDFLKYNWKFKGDKPWEISSTVKSESLFGAKSGSINILERSEMYLEGQVLVDDTISFYRKVSSENGYDFLRFYIDGNEINSWSGNKDWAKVSYPVSAGSHRLSWIYEKDEATSAGLDAAWIDYIQLPAFSQVSDGPLTITALAVPDTICAGRQSQLYVFAKGGTNEYSYSWTSDSKLENSVIFDPLVSPLETTEYDVSVTSGLLSAAGTLTVAVEPLPATPLVTVSDENLFSSASDGNQWYNSQGLIPGATNQGFPPAKTDTYYVIVNTTQGCQSKASNKVEFEFTGFNTSVENGLSVYPNPFTDKLYIEYTLKSAGQVKIVIYNSLGNEVSIIENSEKTAGTHKAVTDGCHWAAGIYTCKIISNQGVQLVKVIKTNP